MIKPSTVHHPVLMVDDNESICSMMVLTLREAGIKNVHSISDSRKVLPFLQEHGAVLVLLDLFMPHLSGYDLLTVIRRDYPGIQVVVISGANDLSAAVECMKLGALDYLSGVGGEFVSVNVAGLDDATFSDTLFGHKKGAYTGADQACTDNVSFGFRFKSNHPPTPSLKGRRGSFSSVLILDGEVFSSPPVSLKSAYFW